MPPELADVRIAPVQMRPHALARPWLALGRMRGERLARVLWAIVACCACGQGAPRDLPTCITRVTRAEIAFAGVDSVDVLFVIDGSPSMREEQAALQRELPAILERFVTGKRLDGIDTTPVRDLHVGVVSADLGTGGIDGAVP